MLCVFCKFMMSTSALELQIKASEENKLLLQETGRLGLKLKCKFSRVSVTALFY